ncbi:MAG TPA: dihydrofolate reductase [Solirubrobacteraceae bacterium]|nr:dihydrofolate reductase [Solirubrobacteraceae bacterium]
MLSLVVARSENGVIGRDGGLPWRLPSDLRRFRELTSGGTVLMGRRTFESLPAAFRPLPDRRNLVLSAKAGYAPAGAEVFADLDSALEACAGECFVIGGGATYRQALALARRAYVTEVAGEIDGDAFFPELPDREWRCRERGESLAENGHSFRLCVYERVPSVHARAR